MLHRAHNDRSLLFKLPIEILHNILELVPIPCTRRWKHYHPFWYDSLADSSMLMPVIHTCRRLREVALAHPVIWTTFQASFKKLALARQMATWSAYVPLNAVGSDVGVLNGLPPNTRFRSIHLYDIGKDCRNVRALVEQFSSPTLSSFSLLCDEKYDWDAKESSQPLSLVRATNLRHLVLDEARALPNKGFLKLTHLALLGLLTPKLHARFTGFIRECPLLESVALSDFSLADEDAPNNPAPIPLHHLRHVALIDFSPNALSCYLTLLQPRVRGSSVQVLGYRARDTSFPHRFLLPPDSDPQQGQTQAKVCIGMHPTGVGDGSISLTTVFAHTTRRIASWVPQLRLNGIPTFQWPSIVFAGHATSPWTIDEVWLYGLGSSSKPWTCSPLKLFPRARTVVLVAEGGTHHGGPPSLHLLPSVHDAGCNSQSEAGELVGITTLRLVHGFKEYDGFCKFAASHGASGHSCRGETRYDHLPLKRLIQDFRSGGYGYVKHFVLQVTLHINVDGRELDVLRNLGNFETFTFERIDELPDMPGHSDPAYRGSGRYPGALW